MNLCINCAHYSQDKLCLNPNNYIINPQTGSSMMKSLPHIMRNAGFFETYIENLCGRKGRWYEHKKETNVLPFNKFKQGENNALES